MPRCSTVGAPNPSGLAACVIRQGPRTWHFNGNLDFLFNHHLHLLLNHSLRGAVCIHIAELHLPLVRHFALAPLRLQPVQLHHVVAQRRQQRFHGFRARAAGLGPRGREILRAPPLRHRQRGAAPAGAGQNAEGAVRLGGGAHEVLRLLPRMQPTPVPEARPGAAAREGAEVEAMTSTVVLCGRLHLSMQKLRGHPAFLFGFSFAFQVFPQVHGRSSHVALRVIVVGVPHLTLFIISRGCTTSCALLLGCCSCPQQHRPCS
mmetsp:Transcript_87927/g.139663  ORF Transcript_87927/g.139663 Transcript_87927/m.139663 type:complete len:261 (-) Transcript_87927:558-1340(-)